MAFAAFSGVLQLMVMGSWTRTVRLRMLLLSVGVGIYGCGLAAVALQFAYTRTVAAVTQLRSCRKQLEVADD